jgi:hypothetical protein
MCLLASRAGNPSADASLLHAMHLRIDRLLEANQGASREFRSDPVLASIFCGRGSDYLGPEWLHSSSQTGTHAGIRV